MIRHYVFEKDIKLSDHFMLSEFRCHNGSKIILVNDDLLTALEAFRKIINKPIHLLSAYRDPSYNDQVGGADDSQHPKGNAVDVRVDGMTPKQVADAAIKSGLFKGIGIYNTFTHLDVRPKLVNMVKRKYDFWDNRTVK